MKFSFTKGVLTGVIATTALTTTVAYATVGSETIEAFFRDIKIVMDGRTLNPADESGKVVEPFIVDGTTYLPVRAISNALGIKIDWDNDTNTIYLGEKSDKEVVQLDNEDYIYVFTGSIKGPDTLKLRGEDVPVFNYINSHAEVVLGEKYTTLKAKAFVEDGYTNSKNIKITNLDNGKVLYDKTIDPLLKEPIEITLDVTGIDKLKINTSNGTLADITVQK